MKILISGMCGHMGQAVLRLCGEGVRGAEAVCGVDINAASCSGSVPCFDSFDNVNTQADCIIDFSHHSCTDVLLAYAEKTATPVILCTTGQTEEELAAIRAASEKIPVFFSANMSLGIALLVELAKKTAAAMPDAEIEIIEQHHDRKLDAPSGTAIMLADAIKEVRPNAYANCGRSGHGKRTQDEIGIHSVRMGNIVGIHEVIIGTNSQTITLKHEAHDRALFAEGALAAAQFMCAQPRPAGLYNMKDMVKE